MILLDDRTGSGDLIRYLRGVAKLSRLSFGDAQIEGNGPEGRPVLVGVEVKKVADVLTCITDGRFAGHQLPGLQASYEVVYLVVEGDYRVGKEGLLEVMRYHMWRPILLGSRKFMYREMDNWLTTMEMKGGVKIRRTGGRQETAQFLKDLYGWWTGREWEEHRAHLAFHDPGPPVAMLRKPSLLRRMAKELPGVGWERSLEVEKRFDSVLEMALASELDWKDIPGIGKGIANKVRHAIHGEEVR